MGEWLSDPNMWASLLTLTALEIVLGIDNLVFLTIITDRLPEDRKPMARQVGLIGALGLRVVLLFSVVWLAGLTATVFSLFGLAFSWRDIVLLVGGLFLLAKGTHEIHNEMEDEDDGPAGGDGGKRGASFASAIVQIMIMDLVFSLDSVITAVGMTSDLPVMVTAVVIAIGIMMFAAGPVGDFISRHPTTKMLALSFLLLVGVALIGDGLHFHIPRGFLYFAIGFSVLVEALNLVVARRRRARREQA